MIQEEINKKYKDKIWNINYYLKEYIDEINKLILLDDDCESIGLKRRYNKQWLETAKIFTLWQKNLILLAKEKNIKDKQFQFIYKWNKMENTQTKKPYTYKEVGELLLTLYKKRSILEKELVSVNEEIELSEIMLMFAYNREKKQF